MKRSGLIAGLVIIALIAGSVLAFGKSYARDIYTYDCEILEQRPEQLTKFCADGGVYVYDIKWKSWGYNGAEGTGTYSQNLCVNTRNGILLPSGNSYDNWDVAEFAINMKDFESNG